VAVQVADMQNGVQWLSTGIVSVSLVRTPPPHSSAWKVIFLRALCVMCRRMAT
jgi:hypothetical protein